MEIQEIKQLGKELVALDEKIELLTSERENKSGVLGQLARNALAGSVYDDLQFIGIDEKDNRFIFDQVDRYSGESQNWVRFTPEQLCDTKKHAKNN